MLVQVVLVDLLGALVEFEFALLAGFLLAGCAFAGCGGLAPGFFAGLGGGLGLGARLTVLAGLRLGCIVGFGCGLGWSRFAGPADDIVVGINLELGRSALLALFTDLARHISQRLRMG